MHEGVVIAIGQITPVSARPDDVVIGPAYPRAAITLPDSVDAPD